MIVAAHPMASEAGRDILRAGGSAVDAAIAAQMVLNLVEPQSSGIGGGAFLMHFREADRKIEAYDGRETAPEKIRPEVFIRSNGKRRAFQDVGTGGTAVGVPGLIQMLYLAHRDHGNLPWARLFDPAIQLAEKGFKVSRRLNKMIRRAKDMRDFPAARAYFYTPSGNPLPVGHRLRNPPLADTLRLIASKGPDAFYAGAISKDIAVTVKSAVHNPAVMTQADIARYKAKKRTPVCIVYRDKRVCGMPPPTSGGITVLQILGLLKPFKMSQIQPGSVEAVHLISEASRLAYADRAQYIGDPDFVLVPVRGMLNSSYLRRRSKQINSAGSMGKAMPGLPPSSEHMRLAPDAREGFPSTSHLSVIDADGNAVSMTSSIARAFGSRLLVRGFLLNNQLSDFAYSPRRNGRSVANAVAPRKRPRSSMSPKLVLNQDGQLFAIVGSPGGSRIIAYVAKTLIGLIDWKLGMQAAIDLPTHTNRNGWTELEKGTQLVKYVDALRGLGHNVRIRTLTSGLHGIRVTPRGYDGGADRRREGIALGD
ncbi:MAG: gamma-glutamyltransferase [Pseudomonadota bacterium]|nr:gamma-glutamyltransferase [Pseudomonadota bacterium]